MTTIAILHPMTLLGKELREALGGRPAFAGAEVRLLSTDEAEIGSLTEAAGSAAIVQGWQEGELEGVDLAFLCGGIEGNRPVLDALPEGATAVLLSLDATAADGRPVVAGVNSAAAERGRVLVSPHPAVILLAHLLQPLRGLAIEEAVATLVQPASMQGEPGLDELFEDTRRIYTMGERKKTPVFGRQLAFNLLPAQNDAAHLAAELREVLAGEPPVALEVVQGGVFHGFSASLYLRCAAPPGVKAIRKALAASPALELAAAPRHLGPIDVAGGDRVLVGTVREEASPAGGYWLWAVMDNLTRGGVVNALEIAEAVL